MVVQVNARRATIHEQATHAVDAVVQNARTLHQHVTKLRGANAHSRRVAHGAVLDAKPVAANPNRRHILPCQPADVFDEAVLDGIALAKQRDAAAPRMSDVARANHIVRAAHMHAARSVFRVAKAIRMPRAHDILAAVKTPRCVMTKHTALHHAAPRIFQQHRRSAKPQPAQRHALAARDIEAPQPHLRLHAIRARSHAIGRPEIELPVFPMPLPRRIQRPKMPRDVTVARSLKLFVPQIEIRLRDTQRRLLRAGDDAIVRAVAIVPDRSTKNTADPRARAPFLCGKLHRRCAVRLPVAHHDLRP